MRQALARFGIGIVLSLGLLLSWPAAAQTPRGHWTDWQEAQGAPEFCPGVGCPSLADSCLSGSALWWPSAPEPHLKSCERTDGDTGHARVDALCCGATYNAWPDLDCDSGYETDIDGSQFTCVKIRDDSPSCEIESNGAGEPACSPPVANPIYPNEGSKRETVADFSTAGANALSFVRTYDSTGSAVATVFRNPLGIKWQSNFDRYLQDTSSSAKTLFRPDGSVIRFTLVSGVWKPAADIPVKLVQNGTNWEYASLKDTVETYDSSFRLTEIRERDGYTQTLSYDGNGHLSGVSDSYGRSLLFSYTGDRMTQMIAADGQVYNYEYDATITVGVTLVPDRLIHVTYPRQESIGGSRPEITYHYEDALFPGYLTGITDENGVRYVTWAYNDDGRAISSEHAGGVDHYSLTFNDTDNSRPVTNPLGEETIYRYSVVQGRKKLASVERQASVNTPAATATYTYDTNGFIASYADFEGHVTTYVHDSRGLQTSRTEAYGTSVARTITTTWHSTLRVPTQIVEPGKTTDFTYDSAGRVLTKTETDTRTQSVPYSTNSQTRTWTYTWDSTGLLQTVNGPRTDVMDTTTYSWSSGVLSSVTNALSQTTQINAVNQRGLPTQITDPNGVVTDLAYNQRGWLTSVTKRSSGGDAATGFEYDAVGQITAIVQPDGVRLEYEYDNAHRLSAVENSLGERIEYTLDDMGNRTAETIKATGGSIVKSMTRSYDELGRLLSSIGAASQTTAFAYDKNDNVTSITDPLSGVTAQAYDALDRLITSTDPATEVTAYGYDDQDHLTSVTDARSVQTAYVYDGFGRVIQTASPDGGTTVYHYDPADNLTEKTDGRSVVTQYSYDAVNRITAKTFPAATAENVAYSYDDSTSGHFGIGRLATITDESGSTAFIYDSRGNVVQETRTIAGTAYVTGYVYDVADRLTQMVYPSGRFVAYARDTLGRVTSVTTQSSSSAAPAAIASNIAYKPFGPIASMLYGNGLARSYSYDGDYRLTDLVTGDVDTFVQDLAYGYDAADNITSIADAIASGRSQAFTYDSLFRLKTAAATGTYGSIAYNYDDVGNRTSVVDGAGTESYSTDTSSNRLLSATLGSTTRSFSYDGAGNITADATGSTTYALAYNKANRLAGVSLNGTPDTDYLYNALGERVKKAPAATPTAGSRFHYDRDGKLIAETDSTGAVIREYAWLGVPGSGPGMPIGEFTNASAGTPPGQTQVDNSDAGASFTGNWTTATAGTGYTGSNYRQHTPEAVPAGGATIDNGSAAFTTTGVWQTLTSPSGFEGSDYRARNQAADGYGSEIIVDNTDAGFAATGSWTSSTNLNGYYGTDYLVHLTNQLPPESIVIDNVDSGFQLFGTWSTSTNGGADKYGADFRYASPNQAASGSVITDNSDANTALTGTWSTSTASGKYGANFRYHAAGTGTNTFTWTPSIPSAQQYNVYAWWRQLSDRATNAPFTVYHDGGSTTVPVNQTTDGSQWNLLGTFSLTPGQNHRVVLTDNANGLVIADAVMITPVDGLNRAVWTPTIPQAEQYNVYGWWRNYSDRATNAPFTIFHDAGSTTVTANQQNDGGQWNLLGAFAMSPGQNERVALSDQANGLVIADAVRVTRVGAPPPTATWTPSLPARDQYEVYARWEASSSRATNAPFTIHHEGPSAGSGQASTTVLMNQQQNDSTWVLLGSFTMAPGQNHRVELADTANDDYVVADAVKFVPKNAAKAATWAIAGSQIPQTGSYQVYAKWPAASTHATDATYTVTSEGGSTAVTVNQRVNGGQWNLLGSFPFDAGGSGYKVELADSENGRVAADAIYIAGAAGPSSDAFTWTPTFPSAGAYQVYARWPASSGNTGAAQYTVTRDGGTSTITLNQKQNGSAWVLLGSYNFTPAAGHKVTLAASADGATIADALLFVGAGTQPANLLYVHADHLGSPQKMTDASQATVWDGVFDPFGEEVAITGLGAMPMRFPGQYADDETGYSYNYFRDYEPNLGRYLQSDPIGLLGGLNLYGYAGGNAVNYDDATGENPWIARGLYLAALYCAKHRKLCREIMECVARPIMCKKKFCRAGNALYHGVCDNIRCRSTDSCSTLLMKTELTQTCLSLRVVTSLFCYGRGDRGHEQQIQDVQRKLNRCQRLINLNCGMVCVPNGNDSSPEA